MALEYRKDGEVTFTRNSAGTYLVDGVLTDAGVNDARFENAGLLSEVSATNEVFNSSDPDTWSNPADMSFSTFSVNEFIARRCIFDGVKGDGSLSSIIPSASPVTSPDGNSVTYSLIMRHVSGEFEFRVRFDDGSFYGERTIQVDTKTLELDDGVLQSTVTDIADGWFIFTATRVSDNTVMGDITALCSMIAVNTDNGATIEIMTPQFETGSLNSSYIPTTGVPVTRTKDIASMSSSNIPYGDWTIAADVVTFAGEVDNMVLGSGDTINGLFLNFKGDDSVGFRLGTSLATVVSAFVKGSVTKTVIRKDNTSIYLDTSLGSDVVTKANDSLLTSLFYLGSDGVADNQLNGNLQNFQINDRLWTNQEVSDYVNG